MDNGQEKNNYLGHIKLSVTAIDVRRGRAQNRCGYINQLIVFIGVI